MHVDVFHVSVVSSAPVLTQFQPKPKKRLNRKALVRSIGTEIKEICTKA